MSTKTVPFYVVRAEVDGQPESYLAGVYPTEALAQARCDELEADGYDLTWYDVVEMGPMGGSCLEANR